AQFAQLAREAGGISTGDLLRVVKERRERKDRVAEARLVGPADDVVTMTSIHVSKGLDWPVVFWADLNGKGRTNGDKLLITRDAICLGEANTTAKEQSPEYTQLRDRCNAEEQAEKKRLWYVAATRAEELLIVSGIPRAGLQKNSTAAMICEAIPDLATAADGSTVSYVSRGGERFEAIVRVAGDVVPAADGALATARAHAPLAYADVVVPDPARVTLPPAAIFAPVGPPRHSATALMAHERCA